LDTRFWEGLRLGGPDSFSQQMVMLHPVGGMDRIAAAFVEQVGPVIRYNAEVREIRQTPSGVRIVYRDRPSGDVQELQGAFCICTVPLPLLKDIPADFSPTMRAAIASVPYTRSTRIGLQMARRFWEEDDGIYGGITVTDQAIRQIHYPSTEYHAKKGILLGAYTINDEAFGQMTPAARISAALEQGQRIHPQYAAEFENGFAVSWENVPFNASGWASYSPDVRRQLYATLIQPDGFLYLAGEHLSYLTGWQEGAVRSAQHVCSDIHARVIQTA
jgi:monoamine oxidase